MTNKNLPVLRGFTFEGNGYIGIKVFCPFCDKFHSHGWGEGETKPAGRSPHCTTRGEHYPNGYWIAPFKKMDQKDIKRYLKNE
jgi:hypothetical protein